ncbi:unnamed protein product [Mycena citricolor]|uniref:Flavin reductase like domain-containing protein n=1 Tax=Mycena citricolor TaxID=2018698 RepID=A0AAD2H9J7_9AGAR|nr:unnamed protein product [Mycena citricolor]
MSDPGSSLPPFEPSSFKYTQPPDAEFTFGQKAASTEGGRQWAEQEKLGWETIDARTTDPRRVISASVLSRSLNLYQRENESGVGNIAPFSFFNQVSYNPTVISFASTGGANKFKDTVNNIRATKEFTVSLISEPWIAQANAASIDAPPDVSEWDIAGLTREPSTSVKPPRIKESAFSLECELLQIVEIKNDAGEVRSSLVLGTVKLVHVRKAVLNEAGTAIDPAKYMAVSRLGDTTYALVGNGFRMPRPVWNKVEVDARKAAGTS